MVTLSDLQLPLIAAIQTIDCRRSSADFKNAWSIDSKKFNELLRLVMPAVEKQDSRMRMAISSKTKLEITLRYLASGDNQRHGLVVKSVRLGSW